MKKTKFKRRIENAASAFFENESENAFENKLTFTRDSALLEQEKSTGFNEKGDLLIKILKRTFLFLPGAFYLFIGMMAILEFDVIRIQPWSILLVFSIGGFMTIFGIGNIKNPKHLAIPLAISAISIAAYAAFSIFGDAKTVFQYGIYFFPLALMSALIVKSLVDNSDEPKN